MYIKSYPNMNLEKRFYFTSLVQLFRIMQVNHVFALRDELKRYTGFRSSIRSVVQQGVDTINQGDFIIPIKSGDSPIFQAIEAVFTNEKTSYKANALTERVITCITNNLFQDEALVSLVRSLSFGYNLIAFNIAHNLINHMTANILNSFPDIFILQSFFSLSIGLMTHSDPAISGASYATFQQMLQTVIEKIQNSKPNPSDFTIYIKEKYGKLTDQFENSLTFILYLLFNDLSCMSINLPTTWLVLNEKPTSQIFDMLETIIHSFPDFFHSIPQLGTVFEGSVIQSISDPAALEFIVGFIETFATTSVNLCAAIFREFLPQLSATNISTLYFFHCVSLRKQDLALNFYLYCDDENMMVQLIDGLRSLVNMAVVPEMPLSFQSKQWRLNKLNEGNQSIFLFNSPFEISFAIIKSFSESEDKKLEGFFKATHSNLFEMIIYGIKYASMDSFQITVRSLLSLLILLERFSIKDGLENIIPVICNFDQLAEAQRLTESEREMFGINQKDTNWNRFIYKLCTNAPDVCSDYWPLIFASLFSSNEDVDLSPSFARSFNNDQAKLVLEALIMLRPFPNTFINDYLISNIDRFDQLWPVLEKSFYTEIGKNKKFDADIFVMFIDIIKKGFICGTESKLLQFGSHIMKSQHSLSIENKQSVLQQLRTVLSNSAQDVNEGWPFLFDILDPDNYGEETDLMKTSFSLFTMICNDNIHTINQQYIGDCINLIFKYTHQIVDINISLSSLDLLWNAFGSYHQTSESWNKVIDDLILTFYDERVDVAQGATRTLFSLLLSNFDQISKDVIFTLVSEKFPKLLESFDYTKEATWPALQLILNELAHFTCAMYNQIDNNSMSDTFLSLLIKKQAEFIIDCENSDIINNSFMFYETFVNQSMNKEIHLKAIESIQLIVDNKLMKVTNENSIILSAFGRTLSRIIKTFNNNIEESQFYTWIPFIEKLILKLPTFAFVHVASSRSLLAYISILPKPEEYSLAIFQLAVNIVQEKGDDEKMVEFIADICSQMLSKTQFKALLLIKLKPVLNKFAKHEVLQEFVTEKDYGAERKDELIECFNIIKETEPELATEIDEKIASFTQ